MNPISRAISIRQPWIELILQGEKREEYRSRRTKIRERVYLYASATPADSPPTWQRLNVTPGALPTGVILGSVEIVGCYWNAERKAYAYVLRHPRRLDSHLTPRNQPQPIFWRPQF